MKYLFVLISCLCIDTVFAQSKPNIILIMADDMGNGEFGFTSSGTQLFSTPTIDSLRAGGMYFSAFYTQPSCTPSRISFMSGKYCHRHGFANWYVFASEDRGIPDTVQTVAEYLKEAGYVTSLFGKWHLGANKVSQSPLKQGFDYFFGNLQANCDYYDKSHWGVTDLTENGNRYVDTTTYYTELLTDKALNWMNTAVQDTTCPFFMYMAYTSPHANSYFELQAPAERVAEAPASFNSNAKIQWAMDKIMDEQINRIWTRVRELGIDSNTIIIVTSDNGAILERGSNYPFSGAKGAIKDGGNHVPMIWYQPGVIAANSTYDTLAHMIDLLPTIVQGIGNKATDFTDGLNLYPSMMGLAAKPVNRYLILHLDNYRMWGIRKWGYTLLNNGSSPIANNTSLSENKLLFNVWTDVGQTTDLSVSLPEVVSSLEGIIDSRMSEFRDKEHTGTWSEDIYSPLPLYYGQQSFYYNMDFIYYLLNQPR